MIWIGLLCALLIIGVAGFLFFVMLNQLVKSQLELLTKTAREEISPVEEITAEGLTFKAIVVIKTTFL